MKAISLLVFVHGSPIRGFGYEGLSSWSVSLVLKAAVNAMSIGGAAVWQLKVVLVLVVESQDQEGKGG